jgi:hypothetical protein
MMKPRSPFEHIGCCAVIAITMVLAPTLALGAAKPIAHSGFDGLWQRIDLPRVARPEGECCNFEGWSAMRAMLQPWALAVMEKRKAGQISGNVVPTNTLECRPDGTPTVIEIPYPFQFLRTQNDTTILYEADYQSRTIKMNGTHPATPKLTWYGDSIGRWEGEDLVVDTIGMSSKGQINWDGIPHTDQLHVIERYRVTAPGALELTLTLIDPGTFVSPWTVIKHYRRNSERKLMEYVCAENNRDAAVPSQ